MNVISLLFALFYAVILTSLLITLFGSVRNWKSSWPLFVIILFGALAAFFWIRPIGPTLYGHHFLPGFLAALILALLLAATMRGRKRKRITKKENKEIQENTTSTTYYKLHPTERPKEIYSGDEPVENAVVSGFLWILMILLTFIILAGILIKGPYNEL